MGAVEPYLKAVMPKFPATTFLLWPLRLKTLTFHQTFALPTSPQFVLIGVLASLPDEHLAEALENLRQASRSSSLGDCYNSYRSNTSNENRSPKCTLDSYVKLFSGKKGVYLALFNSTNLMWIYGKWNLRDKIHQNS